MDAAIRTRGLTKRYRDVVALGDVDLDVPVGKIFGYLGPNGAGKTTTIRMLAGLIRPTRGRAEVLGMDAVTEVDHVQARIGYLPGDFAAYPDLTAAQYLQFLGNLRGMKDLSLVDVLAKRFELNLTRRIGTLSHGNRQKVGVIQAFMHEPELLVLDEPTSGLDPLMQQEFLGLLRETRDAGRTVFLSSHILNEVEAVADMVGILRAGRLVVVETVDNLKRRALRRIDLTFEAPPPIAELESLPGVREVTGFDHVAHLVVEGSTAELFEVAAPHGVMDIVTHDIDLEEIFLTYYAEEG